MCVHNSIATVFRCVNSHKTFGSSLKSWEFPHNDCRRRRWAEGTASKAKLGCGSCFFVKTLSQQLLLTLSVRTVLFMASELVHPWLIWFVCYNSSFRPILRTWWFSLCKVLIIWVMTIAFVLIRSHSPSARSFRFAHYHLVTCVFLYSGLGINFKHESCTFLVRTTYLFPLMSISWRW